MGIQESYPREQLYLVYVFSTMVNMTMREVESEYIKDTVKRR